MIMDRLTLLDDSCLICNLLAKLTLLKLLNVVALILNMLVSYF